MTNQAASSRGPVTAELGRQATKLTISAVILVVSIVLFVLPATSIMRGTILGGGNQVTLSVSDAAYDSDVVSVLKKRADNLYERNLSVEAVDENTVVVRVPALYDAQSVAESLVGTGHVELVSQLDISDANELSSLTSSSTDNLTLVAGTYSAFITGEDITSAQVIAVSSSSSYITSGTTYAVQMTLDDDAAAAFAQETEELSSSYGIIAVVVDGEVVSTPYVSQKIESSEVTVSGFTREEAYAFAAKLNSGELPCTLSIGETVAFEDVCGGLAPYAAIAAVVLGGIVVSALCALKCGRGAWLVAPSLVATTIFGLGLMSIIGTFDLVILGWLELVVGFCVAVLSALASLMGAYSYHSNRESGLSVRKSQQNAFEQVLFFEHLYLVLDVVAVVLSFVCAMAPAVSNALPSHITEITWTLAAGLTAEIILARLFKEPMLCVVTAPDTQDASVDDSADDAKINREAPANSDAQNSAE